MGRHRTGRVSALPNDRVNGSLRRSPRVDSSHVPTRSAGCANHGRPSSRPGDGCCLATGGDTFDAFVVAGFRCASRWFDRPGSRTTACTNEARLVARADRSAAGRKGGRRANPGGAPPTLDWRRASAFRAGGRLGRIARRSATGRRRSLALCGGERHGFGRIRGACQWGDLPRARHRIGTPMGACRLRVPHQSSDRARTGSSGSLEDRSWRGVASIAARPLGARRPCRSSHHARRAARTWTESSARGAEGWIDRSIAYELSRGAVGVRG